MGKLKILCLHGYHQNKDIFRQKTGSFRKPLKKWVDFEFLDAPHILGAISPELKELETSLNKDTASGSNVVLDEGRGWWLKTPQEGESDGIERSLLLFEDTLNEKGPFDGVMGFSQGAALLGLTCILLKNKLTTVKFVILVAGFKSEMPGHKQFYDIDAKINIPSLHVIGETDKIISPERSRELMHLFAYSTEVPHPGGHYVPMSRELRDVFKKFVEQFMSV